MVRFSNAEREWFDRFWSAYPRKVGKPAAAKAFARVKPDEATLDAMLRAIARQRRSEQWRESVRFIPHPATWLNQRRWEDELPTIYGVLTDEGQSYVGIHATGPKAAAHDEVAAPPPHEDGWTLAEVNADMLKRAEFNLDAPLLPAGVASIAYTAGRDTPIIRHGKFPSRVHCRHEPRCTSDRMHATALALGRPEVEP